MSLALMSDDGLETQCVAWFNSCLSAELLQLRPGWSRTEKLMLRTLCSLGIDFSHADG